jgi:hypothetical protein
MAANRGRLYTPETLNVAYAAFTECLKSTQTSQPLDVKARAGFRIRLVQAILRAIAAGERDPDALKAIGLKSVGQPIGPE